MSKTSFGHMRVTQAGVHVTVTTTTAPYTLPLAADGTNPRFIRCMTEPTAAGVSTCAYINVGQLGVTAASTNVLVTSNEQVILHTRGMAYFAVLAPSATCNISVVPLEDC